MLNEDQLGVEPLVQEGWRWVFYHARDNIREASFLIGFSRAFRMRLGVPASWARWSRHQGKQISYWSQAVHRKMIELLDQMYEEQIKSYIR